MAYIDQLVATRQQSLDLFLTNGGQKKEHGCLGSEAAPFIRDAALLTHPLYSTCILSNAKARVQSLETSLAVHYGNNLTVDETDIETPSSYSTRQNKYGVSSIQFDQEGVLFAVGGSSGTVRVYDFDEVYARMQIRPRDAPALRPVVHFDTRRDISHIAWSHVRPNDIAVAYLFRPEVHVFDLSEIDDSPGGGGEESPTRVLETDSKGGSGHNVLLYWHSEKNETAPASTHMTTTGSRNISAHTGSGSAAGTRRVSEGIIAGSVSGYIRFWNTSTSATTRSNSKNFVWNLLADPHRTSVTASPVVALLQVTSNDTHATATLLLAATAQGVMTVWDLSDLRPGSFGSMQPEPKCLQRVDFAPQLMTYGGVTLIGACSTRPAVCHACRSSRDASAAAACASGQKRAHSMSHWRQQNVQVVRSTAVPQSAQVLSKSSAASNGSSKAATTLRGAAQEDIVLTLSTGSVFRADLSSETAELVRTGKGGTGQVAVPAEAKKVATVINDPRLGVVVSYEELRREGSLNSVTGTTGIVDGTQRSVLPAVIPAWCSTSFLSDRALSDTVAGSCDDVQSDLYRSLAQCGLSDRSNGAEVVLFAEPSGESTGTRLVGVDVGTAPVQSFYPFVHSLGGACSISGKDYDAWTGVSRSNMRRSTDISTTLPGFVLAAQPGEFEVTTTHDLQMYLCAEVAAAASYSKASDVRFDWSYHRGILCGLQDVDNALTVFGSDGLPYPSTTSSNAIAQVSNHRLVLQRPYVGPEVRGGYPRVLLQAALVPSGRTANVSGAVRSASDTRAGDQITSSTVADHLTALCAHPTYPFLIAGTRSDRISLLNPVKYRLTHQEIEVASRVEDISMCALEEEERLLAQRAAAASSSGSANGSGRGSVSRAAQSWRRVLPSREGDNLFDLCVNASAPGAEEDAQSMEADALRTLLPGSLSAEGDASDHSEDAESEQQLDDTDLHFADQDALVDLTAEPATSTSVQVVDVLELGVEPIRPANAVVVDDVPLKSFPVPVQRSEASAAGKRGVGECSVAALFAGPNKVSKTNATSSAPAGKLVLERTQPRSLAATTLPSVSRAKLPLFSSSRAQESKPSASSGIQKRVGKVLNPFAVAAAPSQEPKRNLLSTLARAKENVPAVPVAAAATKVPGNTATAMGTKLTASAKPAGGSGIASKTPGIAAFFSVKK